MFCERQRANDRRRAARAAAAASSGSTLHHGARVRGSWEAAAACVHGHARHASFCQLIQLFHAVCLPALPSSHAVSPEGERWAAELLAAAKSQRDMPALAGGCPGRRWLACSPAACLSCMRWGQTRHTTAHRPAGPAPNRLACPLRCFAADRSCLLMDETSLENTFTCQPQQRNIHGRIFGGFLMRRAFELAHSTAYLFAGSRPYAGGWGGAGLTARHSALVQCRHACRCRRCPLLLGGVLLWGSRLPPVVRPGYCVRMHTSSNTPPLPFPSRPHCSGGGGGDVQTPGVHRRSAAHAHPGAAHLALPG